MGGATMVSMHRVISHITRPGTYIIIHRVSILSELVHGVDIIRSKRARGPCDARRGVIFAPLRRRPRDGLISYPTRDARCAVIGAPLGGG